METQMKGSNSLNSHHGESMNSRADKMSGLGKKNGKNSPEVFQTNF